jgi:GTP cyclohydrolase I
MNVHTPEIDRKPSREEAEAALALLRHWAGGRRTRKSRRWTRGRRCCRGRAIRCCRAPIRRISATDAAYKATLPDLQNGPASLIRGEKAVIQHVGISNFRLPIRTAPATAGR